MTIAAPQPLAPRPAGALEAHITGLGRPCAGQSRRRGVLSPLPSSATINSTKAYLPPPPTGLEVRPAKGRRLPSSFIISGLVIPHDASDPAAKTLADFASRPVRPPLPRLLELPSSHLVGRAHPRASDSFPWHHPQKEDALLNQPLMHKFSSPLAQDGRGRLTWNPRNDELSYIFSWAASASARLTPLRSSHLHTAPPYCIIGILRNTFPPCRHSPASPANRTLAWGPQPRFASNVFLLAFCLYDDRTKQG